MKTEKQRAASAAEFAERWKGRGYEKGDSQLFWTELLTEVFGIENPSQFIRYEEQVKVDKTNFIDGHIPSTRVLIEQKSIDKDLRKGSVQSDGSILNPYQQAKRYVANMPLSEHPRWIVTCNFKEFLVYDMEQPNGEPEQILLENLGKEYYRLQFLVDAKSEHLSKEMEVSMQASEIVGKIYEALLKQYDDNSPEALRWLNILCVRIVFCLYAEDAEIFLHDQFHDYLARYEVDDLRNALIRLFDVLKTPQEQRSKYLKDDLKAFPYTNGGLFEEEIEIPQFTEELKETLLKNASLDFDWSEISPTIFGAMFESTLNPETRRSGGMHYTSIENIHKVIDPLFLNDLRSELDTILEEKVERQRQKKLDAYQDKLASLTFLDPACGSGNFLTETYLSLRRLENEVIRERYHGQTMMGEFLNPIKVSIQQFYGIEINDFAVTVATTALWISEAQMLAETERIIHQDIEFLPLKSYTNIREGNALRMDWDIIETPSDIPTIHANNVHLIIEPQPQMASEPVVEYDEVNVVTRRMDSDIKPDKLRYQVNYDYIFGNPPFVGARMMAQGSSQKKDVENLFGKIKDVQDLDYVCCWYKKAAQVMQKTHTRAGFVSTNSICQGSQVPILWNVLLNDFHVHINFAYQTFKWNSEASEKAAVHCVIIGFSTDEVKNKYLYTSNGQMLQVSNISPYLFEGDNTFAVSQKTPLCDVPQMNFGNQPRDGGHFVLSEEEKNELIQQEPSIERWIRPYIGAEEFIKQKSRYCLWLRDAQPTDIKQSKILYERVQAVRDFRLSSSAKTTQGYAKVPHLFAQITQPEGVDYLLVPSVSSERRRYVPIGFMKSDVISSNAVQIIPNATLYHFGVLTSNVHMAWMRVVCGRLKSDYRYSKEQVYNTFPWPSPTEAQKAKIEQTAQTILDVRAKYTGTSLADLYDEVTMPADLRKAHKDNDRAVMQAYGFSSKITEDQESLIVAELFKRYQELTK
jgi:type I restriction-modification system DNA methylase subunit